MFSNIMDEVKKFLAQRNSGELTLMAFVAAVLLFAMGTVVGRAIGSL